MKLAHDRERAEHLPGGVRGLPPVPAAEGDLGDLLAGAEAVVDGTAGEAAVAQPVVDGAPEVALQVRAGHTGRLVDREVDGRGERRSDAAQREAARAVRPQAVARLLGHRVSVRRRRQAADARCSTSSVDSGLLGW